METGALGGFWPRCGIAYHLLLESQIPWPNSRGTSKLTSSRLHFRVSAKTSFEQSNFDYMDDTHGLTTDKVTLALLRAIADMAYQDMKKVCTRLLAAIVPPDENSGLLSGVEDKRFTPPKGFTAYKSLQQGDCFFSSLSQVVYGSNDAKDQIRFGSGLFGLVHVNDLVEKFIAEGVDAQQFLLEVGRDEVVTGLHKMTEKRELLRQVLLAEAQQTLRPSSYSGFLQVLFAAGYLQRTIKQYQEGSTSSSANLYTTMVNPYPKWFAGEEDNLYIMWVKTGESVIPNHVVPLRKVTRGRLMMESAWDWKSVPVKCKTSNFGWCLCKPVDKDLLKECLLCQQSSNPECLGISRHFSRINPDVPFICCGDVAKIPKVVITQCSKVSLHLADLVSLQPGKCLTNWVIDFCIYTSSSHETSRFFGYLPTTAWEVAVNRKQQIRRHRQFLRSNMEQPVVLFVVSERGHFLAGAFLQMSQEVFFFDSIQQKQRVYRCHSEKLKRLFDIENTELEVHCVPTQQQTNGVDCGVHTIVNLESLMKIFRTGIKSDWQDTFAAFKWQEVDAVRRSIRDEFLQYQRNKITS